QRGRRGEHQQHVEREEPVDPFGEIDEQAARATRWRHCSSWRRTKCRRTRHPQYARNFRPMSTRSCRTVTLGCRPRTRAMTPAGTQSSWSQPGCRRLEGRLRVFVKFLTKVTSAVKLRPATKA